MQWTVICLSPVNWRPLPRGDRRCFCLGWQWHVRCCRQGQRLMCLLWLCWFRWICCSLPSSLCSAAPLVFPHHSTPHVSPSGHPSCFPITAPRVLPVTAACGAVLLPRRCGQLVEFPAAAPRQLGAAGPLVPGACSAGVPVPGSRGVRSALVRRCPGHPTARLRLPQLLGASEQRRGDGAAEQRPQWSRRLGGERLLTPLSVSLQAKDSDDDDEVTVSVDRDRFMDEFFEQVRGWFLRCGSNASSDLAVRAAAGGGLRPRQEGALRPMLGVPGDQSAGEQEPALHTDLGLSGLARPRGCRAVPPPPHAHAMGRWTGEWWWGVWPPARCCGRPLSSLSWQHLRGAAASARGWFNSVPVVTKQEAVCWRVGGWRIGARSFSTPFARICVGGCWNVSVQAGGWGMKKNLEEDEQSGGVRRGEDGAGGWAGGGHGQRFPRPAMPACLLVVREAGEDASTGLVASLASLVCGWGLNWA